MLINAVAQEVYGGLEEIALLQLGVQLVFSQLVQYKSHVAAVVGEVLRVDEDIIEEDNDEGVQVGFQHGVHEVHEGSRCIG